MNVKCQILKLRNQCKALMTSSILHFTFYILISIVLLTGCASHVEKEPNDAQIEQLTQEKAQLQKQLEQFETENKQLRQQLQVLSGLPKDVKLESINLLKNIKIGRYSGLGNDPITVVTSGASTIKKTPFQHNSGTTVTRIFGWVNMVSPKLSF